jgi:hypothetical protein
VGHRQELLRVRPALEAVHVLAQLVANPTAAQVHEARGLAKPVLGTAKGLTKPHSERLSDFCEFMVRTLRAVRGLP